MENMENINTETEQVKSEIDYSKLENIINKGVEQKTNAILKSYLEQNGVSQDEMQEAINNYKHSKQLKADNEAKKNAEMLKELETLRETVKKNDINNNFNSVLKEFNLDSKTEKLVKNLTNLKDIYTDDKIDTEKIKANIENVLTEYELKAEKKEDTKIIKIGKEETKDDLPDEDAELRKAFGLK